MTRIRWTAPANDDFLGIVRWIEARNPDAAARVGRWILDVAEDLAAHPYLGKPGRSPDTSELVVTRYPYPIVHTVEDDDVAAERPQAIIILRVVRGDAMAAGRQRSHMKGPYPGSPHDPIT